MKIHQVEAELVHADGQMDRHTYLLTYLLTYSMVQSHS